MNIKQIIGLVCLAVGITLIVFANRSMETFGERTSKEFSGNYSDETMRHLIAGIILTVGGGCLVVFGRKKWF